MPSLRQARQAARLSQAQLAQATGLALKTIENIEQGRVSAPNRATRRSIHAFFGDTVTIDYPAERRQPRPTRLPPGQIAFRQLQATSTAELRTLFEHERSHANEARMHLIAAIAFVRGDPQLMETLLSLYQRPTGHPTRLARGHPSAAH